MLSGKIVIVVKIPPAITSVIRDSRTIEIKRVKVDSKKLNSNTTNQYLMLTIITVRRTPIKSTNILISLFRLGVEK
jgi:hypothetical protein